MPAPWLPRVKTVPGERGWRPPCTEAHIETEKGTTVKPTEHNAKSTSAPKTGLLAMLRARLGGRGSGAPIVHRRSLLVALLLTAFSFLLCAPVSALAGTPPFFHGGAQACVSTSHTSMELGSSIYPNGEPTQWAFEYSSSETGPWTPVPGASGTITQAEIEAYPNPSGVEAESHVTAAFTGLTPEVPYYIRLTASNSSGTTVSGLAEDEFTVGIDHPDYICESLPFHPTFVEVEKIAHVTGTAAELQGSLKPHGEEVRWRFEYATSESGAFHPVPGAGGTVLAGEENEYGYVRGQPDPPYFKGIFGSLSGLTPATTYYVRLFAEAEPEPGVHKSATSPVTSFETAGPPVPVAYVVHSVSGEEMVALGAVDPRGLDSHYHFEYVSQQHFEEQGFTGAATTPEVDVGSGFGYVGADGDLPELQPGVTYHYRLFASNEVAPQGVHSGEQTLTVPALPEVGVSEACPNEALRIGPSAALPDCRAYEQVTPAEKHGAEDIDQEVGAATQEFRVSEDGEHFMLHAPGVQWGSSPDPSKSNYFFSRTPGGWQTTSATPQSQASSDSYVPAVFNPDLTEAGVEVGWENSLVSSSPMVELQVGPSGGPYASIASIPRKYVTSVPLLVAASPDLGKLIVGTEDRGLVPGHLSTTKSGDDLYEYSEGQLRQVNVLGGTPGAPIGTCGAGMADGNGFEGLAILNHGGALHTSSAHSVSADGSRVFFYAGFGGQCPNTGELQAGGPRTHLYERVNGVETLDIGEYKFLAANPQGSSLLLEHVNGEAHEAFLYDTETQTAEHLFTVPGSGSNGNELHVKISADFSTIYISTEAALTPEGRAGTGGEVTYRYDVSSKTLHYIPLAPDSEVVNVSANGRYLVFEGSSGGVSGIPDGLPPRQEPGTGEGQIYRYDSSENVVECVSCASPFDPRPKFQSTALFGIYGLDGTPNQWFASEDGDFVFFETPDALVPQDTDGEVHPLSSPEDGEPPELVRSQSSDVYEWRREGVDGCAAVEGCLALISGGRGGGYLTELVGATPSGRDVFFATHESLVPQDTDTAGDVYDARIGGGFPPPPPAPVECEGDSCVAPFAAPSELTPSSASFQGAGNVSAGPPVSGKTVKKTTRKTKKKKKQRRAVKGRRKGAGARRSVRRGGGVK